MRDLRKNANRVRIALCLGIEVYNTILTKLEEAEKVSVYLIEEIETDLTELEELIKTTTRELGSPSSALVKVDVLGFQPGERSKGMIVLRYNLMEKLGLSLGIKPNFTTIRNIATAMRFDLGGENALIFGQIQRS